MKPIVRIAVLFCLGLSFCPSPRVLFSAEGEKEALIKSLIDAREDWIQNASFYGNYIVRDGSFSSEEEALTAASDGTRADTGFACKLKNRYRLRIVLPPYEGRGETIPREIVDKVANDRFSVTYWRYDGDYQGSIFGTRDGIVKKLSGKPGASFRDLDDVGSPWWVFTAQANPLYREKVKASDFGYTKQENGRVLLTVRENRPPVKEGLTGLVLDWEITVRTDTEEPRVERIVTSVYDEGEDTPVSKTITDILEWRECGGVPIPAHFRYVSGDTGPAAQEYPDVRGWSRWEFQFTDLGDRQPADGDFKLEVRPEDEIPPLKRIPENNIIDIDAITDGDLDLNEVPGSDQKPS